MSAREDKAGLLARLPLFASLSPEQLAHVAELAVPRHWDVGEIVFREGDQGDTCYVVQSGRVRICRTVGGRTITLAELRPGAMFGELAIFDGEVRSATVESLEDTAAVAILSRDLRRLLMQHPEVAVKMLSALTVRLRAANEQVTRQSFQTVAGRVAGALRAQVEARQAAGAGEQDVLVEVTQSSIAQLAGSSRESASRFLAELERAGVLTTGRGKITVHEPAALGNYIY